MINTKLEQKNQRKALEQRIASLNEEFLSSETPMAFESLLGSGGYADVYKANYNGTDIAIKILRQNSNTEEFEKAKQIFSHEANMYNEITNNNTDKNSNEQSKYTQEKVVSGSPKVMQHKENYYMSIELMDMTLRDFLQKHDTDIFSKLRLVRDYALSIAEIHDKGYCHRDIKPENLFLKETGYNNVAAKCLDFSKKSGPTKKYFIAKVGDLGTVVEEGKKLPYEEEDKTSGTIKYIAPELLFGESYDKRVDIYALGTVLYEMMYKTHPTGLKDTSNELKYVDSILRKDNYFQPPKTNLEKDIQNVLKNAVAKKQEDRYNNMYEFANAIDNIISNHDFIKANTNMITKKETTCSPIYLPSVTTQPQYN